MDPDGTASQATPQRMRRFLTRSNLVKAAITLVGLGGAFTTGLFIWLGQEELEAATRTPSTPEEMLDQVGKVLGSNGTVLHLQFETTGSSDAIDYTLDVEAWFDFPEKRALITYEQQWANQDEPVLRKELLDGDVVIEIPSLPPSPTRSTVAERRPSCIPSEHYLAAILACGVINGAGFESAPSMEVLPDVEWGGKPAYGLAYSWTYRDSPRGGDFAPPTPTPGVGTPAATVPAGQRTVTVRYVFFVERATRLPLALSATATDDGGAELDGSVIEFDAETIERTEVDPSIWKVEAPVP